MFYEQAQRREIDERLQRSLDCHAGFAGGKTLQKYIDKFKQALKRR